MEIRFGAISWITEHAVQKSKINHCHLNVAKENQAYTQLQADSATSKVGHNSPAVLQHHGLDSLWTCQKRSGKALSLECPFLEICHLCGYGYCNHIHFLTST